MMLKVTMGKPQREWSMKFASIIEAGKSISHAGCPYLSLSLLKWQTVS
jgi:hypothetical protein